MIVWMLIAAAAAVLLWPSQKAEDNPYVPPVTIDEPKKGHSYIASVSSLQVVRQRLIDTQQLGEEQQAAINALTLALVAGSEK